MEKFLAHTARQLLQKHGNNLNDISVLMPNHRPCVYFRQALRDSTEQTIWSPEISTLHDWVFAKSELAFIEPLQQLLELYQVYKGIGGEETLDEFIPTAQIMLSDFDEVDMQLADARLFFKNLAMLKSMEVYSPGEGLSEYSKKYIKFWEQFRLLYFGLRERLLQEKKAYTGMIYRDIAEKVDSIEPGSSKIYFVGFSTLNKSEEKIMQSLLSKGIAEIIWDTDKYYVDNDFQEAGMPFRRYKNKFRIREFAANNFISTEPKKINIIGVAKNIGQTKVMADILSNKLNLDAKTERQTAVIIPDEKLLNPLLAAIPANISALNISMGYPLQDSPIAELLKSIFALHENAERFKGTNKSTRFYYKDVFDLLYHSYTAYLLPDKMVITEFVNYILHQNRMVISHEELNEKLRMKDVDRLFWYTDHADEYLKKLLALVDELRIQFLRISRSREKDMTVDIELLFHFKKILTNLQNTFSDGALKINVKSLRKLLLSSIRSVRVPFDGEPVRGLQIMGMLETRSLDFKNVIILSMNEGIVPSGKNERTYIPYELRREFLSTYHEKDANSAYLFYRLLQRAENIYLVYNTEGDELGGGEKSRFILQLQHELAKVNSNAVIQDYVYSVDPPPPVPDDEINIQKDEGVIQAIMKIAGGNGISPSAINTYINCSLQYYFRYIAKLKERDIEESIEASTLGTAVHFVLENLYKDVLGKELTPDFVKEASGKKKEIESLLKKSLEEQFDGESLKHGKNYLLYRVSVKLVEEFLKQENKYLQMLEDSGSSMKLLMLERDMTQTITIGSREVTIRGKVDRIEESNGIISVADYKTGTPAGSSVQGADMSLFASEPKFAKAMQLLTYAWLYWKAEGGRDIQLRSGIYWLREIANGFDALAIDKNDIITRDVLLQFEEILKNVLTELLNPDVPFAKTKETEHCEFCEFSRICRRD